MSSSAAPAPTPAAEPKAQEEEDGNKKEEKSKPNPKKRSSPVVAKASDRTLPGFEESDASTRWSGPFFFVQAADTQLGLIVNFGDGTIGDQYPNITWDREIELCRLSVRRLNAMRPRPRFLIVCGDMLDAFPDKWPRIREEQERDFMEVYSELDEEIPLVCVCGNHDVGNTPSRETVASYRSSFGDDFFSFWIGGVCFVVINSQYYEDPSLVPEIEKEQEAWLDRTLLRAKEKGAKHTMVFQHIPWFVKDPDEAKFYFNVELDLRKRMLKKFYDAGVRKIFCGHYHRNAGGMYKELEVVVTTAVGCQIGPDTHGMRVVQVKEKEVEHRFHSLDEFPEKIQL